MFLFKIFNNELFIDCNFIINIASCAIFNLKMTVFALAHV